MMEDADAEYFEGLFQTFEDLGWEYNHRTDRNTAAERAAEQVEEGGLVEYNFTHTGTGATLHVSVPDLNQEPPLALAGTLLQGITDPSYDDSDKLVSALDGTQQAIARRNSEGARYVTPANRGDAGTIANVRVPFNYDEEVLEDSIDALSNVSEEVNEMHSSLFEEMERHQ